MRDWMARLSELFENAAEKAGDIGLSERDVLYRETRAVAHECGHAVVAWLSPAVTEVEGIVFHRDHSAATSIIMNRAHPAFLVENALVHLGGLAGEVLVWRRIQSGGFGDDLAKVRGSLQALVFVTSAAELERRWKGCLAESSLDVAAMLRERPPPDLASAMNICFRRAKRLLQDNRAGFDRLVILAAQRGDLSREDIASQFGPRLWAPS